MKLRVIQPVIEGMQKRYSNIPHKISLARSNVNNVRLAHVQDKFSELRLDNERRCFDELIKRLSPSRKKIMAQRTKIKWLKLGNDNNSYFHAAVRDINKYVALFKLDTSEGNTVTRNKKY